MFIRDGEKTMKIHVNTSKYAIPVRIDLRVILVPASGYLRNLVGSSSPLKISGTITNTHRNKEMNVFIQKIHLKKVKYDATTDPNWPEENWITQ